MIKIYKIARKKPCNNFHQVDFCLIISLSDVKQRAALNHHFSEAETQEEKI